MKLSIKLGLLSATNIVLAFSIQWYILMSIGVGEKTDAFFAGMTIPQLILAVISSSLTHVLVPLLSGENDEQVRHDTWAFLILITGLFSGLAMILSFTAEWWVPLTVPGFNSEIQSLTVTLTRIQLFGMVFSAINGVQWASYHARHRFLWVEFVPILTSLFGLGLLTWALPRYGIVAAAWIASTRLGLQTLLLIPSLGRPVKPDFKQPKVKQAWRRIKPLLLGTTYYKTDQLINRFLLSAASGGSLSLYYLAHQIYEAVGYVFDKAIVGPLTPILSTQHKQGDIPALRKLYYRKIITTILLGLTGFTFLLIFGQQLLALLLGYGQINRANLLDLWWIMVWLSGLSIGGMGAMVVNKAFYSLGDTATPTKIASVTYTLQIPLKIMAYHHFGVAGLALTTTLYHLLKFCLLMIFFTKKVRLSFTNTVIK